MTRPLDPTRPRRLQRPQAVRATDPRHTIYSTNGTGRRCPSCGTVTFTQMAGRCRGCGGPR